MAIENSYKNSPEILKPEYVKEKYHKQYDTIIITFQSKVLPGLLENKLVTKLNDVFFGSSFAKYDIYELSNHSNVLFFLSPIGASMAVGLLEEITYVFDIKNVIMYGTCGVLDKEITAGKIIVPTKAYRDEGTSYHYVPASDFIDITNHQVVFDILKTFNIPCVKGPVWTTDAFYRETKAIFEERKAQNIIAVEMEVSAVQAFAVLRKVNFYSFIYSADNLDSSKWENRLLGNFTVEDRVKYFIVASKIAESI